LQQAVDYGHLEVVEELLRDSRCNPACQDNECIIVASGNDDLEMVKALLADNRVDPSARDNEAIQRAHSGAVIQLLMQDSRVKQIMDR
jgi:hypothetical protein